MDVYQAVKWVNVCPTHWAVLDWRMDHMSKWCTAQQEVHHLHLKYILPLHSPGAPSVDRTTPGKLANMLDWRNYTSSTRTSTGIKLKAHLQCGHLCLMRFRTVRLSLPLLILLKQHRFLLKTFVGLWMQHNKRSLLSSDIINFWLTLIIKPLTLSRLNCQTHHFKLVSSHW